jgi:radical SAM protein with 4Fe4S-binding SPASM domain
MSHKFITNNSLRGMLYRQAVSRQAVSLPYSPFTIYIDPCNACNIACTFCPQSNWGASQRGIMDRALFDKVMKEVIELKPSRLFLFCFGEATLNKDLPGMIRTAVDAGLRVRIHTNAFALDEELARSLISSGLQECVFSFDTPDADLYNRLRCGSDFDTALANIRRMIELRDEMKADTPVFRLQELIPDDSSQDKPKNTKAYMDLFKGLSVRFKVKYMHSFAGQGQEEQFAKMQDTGTSHCSQLYRRIVVNFDGKIHACCLDPEGHNILGDIKAGDTIADAWNSPKMMKLRGRTNSGNVAKTPPCNGCEILAQRPRLKGGWLKKAVGTLAWHCFNRRGH